MVRLGKITFKLYCHWKMIFTNYLEDSLQNITLPVQDAASPAADANAAAPADAASRRALLTEAQQTQKKPRALFNNDYICDAGTDSPTYPPTQKASRPGGVGLGLSGVELRVSTHCRGVSFQGDRSNEHDTRSIIRNDFFNNEIFYLVC